MLTKHRLIAAFALLALVGLLGVIFAANCPSTGIAFAPSRREIHRLKNRTTLPTPLDLDSSVTLEALLTPGDDHARWSQTRAAVVEGYVAAVAAAKPERANCFCGRDIHIHLGRQPDAAPHEHFVLEITPRLKPMIIGTSARSAEELKQALVGRWIRAEGWLFFDAQHSAESENVAPQRPDNWRATAWEIHPVTKLEVQ